MYDHRYTPTFTDCVQRYQHRPDVLASLSQTLTELASDPFGNPKLQTHKVKRAQPDTFTSYVTNQGHRLIWRRVGTVIVLLLFGEHDAVYRRAERLRLEIDDTQNVLVVIDEDPGTGQDVPYTKRRTEEGRLFMAWNDAELAAFGFEPREVAVLRRLDAEQELVSLDGRMRQSAWEIAMNLVIYGRPSEQPAEVTADDDLAGAAAEAEITDEPAAGADRPAPVDERVATALRDQTRSPEFVPVAGEDLAAVLTRPIEDWMVYLDPSQEALVHRVHNGPARIRGAAGTGKTVIALHRARALARLGRRVLLTTYVRNLPDVYRQIFARFAPDEAALVEFANVHKWASGYLRARQIPVTIDMRQIDRAWQTAMRTVAAEGTPLRKTGLSTAYLKQEVEWVVRGRGLPDLDAYLALERNGRGTPLSRELRTHVWWLAESYRGELARHGVHDFNDLLRLAYETVRERGVEPGYDAVIIDEAQDLTDVALRLLHAIVGDRPGGLLLVGDGQQSIYPGGFNLASLGIDVRGRSSVLTRNYRNTRQVYEAAQSLMAAQSFDDGEDRAEDGIRSVEFTRSGPAPVVAGFDSEDDHDLALGAAIDEAVQGGAGIGDLAVLVPTHALVDRYADLIASLGLPTQRLEKYDGTPNGYAKIGTYQRAKGLEFKTVFLPRLDTDGLHERMLRGEDNVTYAERLALIRRQLFVAMTRARDGLWLGWVGAATSLLPPSLTGTSAAPSPGR